MMRGVIVQQRFEAWWHEMTGEGSVGIVQQGLEAW